MKRYFLLSLSAILFANILSSCAHQIALKSPSEIIIDKKKAEEKIRKEAK